MKKKLYREDGDKMVAGVASGFAKYFGLDPAIWRLLFLFLIIITGGMFILVYVAAWIIVPERRSADGYDYDLS